MNSRKLSTIALLAALGFAQPVLAQTEQTQPPAANEQTQPMSETPAKSDMTREQETRQAPVQTPEVAAKSDAKMPATGGNIAVQADGTFLASNLIGATVWSLSQEAIGDVNDLLLDDNGSIQGVVIGVGGFLGLGEKLVAYSIDALKVSEAEGEFTLTLNATAEELENVPAFKTSYQKRLEDDAAKAKVEQESKASQPPSPAPAPNTQ